MGWEGKGRVEEVDMNAFDGMVDKGEKGKKLAGGGGEGVEHLMGRMKLHWESNEACSK